jgi:divalent metal cation (Fe/Co/Zn/Cd) transporter
MSLFTLVIVIFIVLAAASLIWWGISRISLPEPVKTVILVVFGLLCLLVIYHFVIGGGLRIS